MKPIYLDNAATTALAPEVREQLIALLDVFGNPSSTHSFGRTAKALVEDTRKKIAANIGAKSNEIIFTAGGTEADNMAIACAVLDLQVKRIISSPLEHPAVLQTLHYYEKHKNIDIIFLPVSKTGSISLADLDKELSKDDVPTLVSLMHANNELGTLLDLEKVAEICQKYKAYLHIDTVQTMGHLPFNLKAIPVHFITAAAHKFHGLKGSGFLYKKENISFTHGIKGGGQERKMRSGTENIYGIVTLGKALDIAYQHLEKDNEYIEKIHQYTKDQLLFAVPNIIFNSPENGLKTILNVQFPAFEKENMLLFLLDIKGIAVSGKSACSSGSSTASSVLLACGIDTDRANVRFSFSRYTTFAEIDQMLEAVKEILK